MLITGSNRGIGLEFVKQFAQLHPDPPKHVFAGCRSPDSAKDLIELQKKYKNITIVKIDLDKEMTFAEAVKVVTDKVGEEGLNLLINNAGVGSLNGIDEVTVDEMIQSYKVNAVGPLMVVKAFLPLLRKAGSGAGEMSCYKSAVINISTGMASIAENDTGGMYSYRSSKAGLNMITKNLSLDLKKDGILVTAIHPGWVKTDMGGPRATTKPEDSIKALLKIMDSLNGEQFTGKFYHFSGREMAW